MFAVTFDHFHLNVKLSLICLQFCNTIVANIFTSYKVVSNCTVGTVVSGSVVVPTTVAFTGADSTQATAAQSAFATALKSQDTSVFGTQYGTVTVAASSVQSVQSTNPQGEPQSLQD